MGTKSEVTGRHGDGGGEIVMPARLRGLMISMAVVGSVFLSAACTDDAASARLAPADLLMPASDLPKGFTPTPLSVSDLIAQNSGFLALADTAEVTPAHCRPAADAALNAGLTDTNAALLAAQGTSGTVVELIAGVERNILSDMATTTGECERTESVLTEGSMRGARLVTEFTTLPAPEADGIRRVHVVRSATTTTLVDGASSVQIGYAGYATIGRSDVEGTEVVAVQLTATGPATEARGADAARETPTEPMTSSEFTALFEKAVDAASN